MSHVIDGLLLGGLYACVALGLTLTYGVMRQVNLAHGELLMGAAYLAYLVSEFSALDPFLSLLVVAPAMFLLAYPIQRGVLNRAAIGRSGTLPVATFGLSVMAQAAFQLTFGAYPHTLNAAYALTSVSILGDRVRTILVMAFAMGLILVTVTHLGLTRLRFGKSLRAAAEDPVAAATVGIDVRHVYAMTFGLAAALSSVGGVLIALAFSITPTSGVGWLVRGFTVIILGGMGSVWGSFLGGLVVGLTEEFGAVWVGPQYRDLIVFSLLLLILVIRPQGLLGAKSG
ncbi:MAG: branched-chain amino acid ABC transporter permease [Ktedonobacterales bacterium]